MTAETIQKFRIGDAPESFNDMRERLGKFFPEDVLRQSGLFSWKEQDDGNGSVTPGPMYAKFRKRITFPIANEQGKTIAFTARALDSQDVDPKAGPKYLNSPETLLYTKGNVLFNLDKAKAAMRKMGFALLVEGQMDCIRVFTSGIENVIASSGTAFTEAQARMVERLLGQDAKRVVLNFDPDNAGQNAAEKTLTLLVEEGFEVRVVTLPGGLDPDRFILENGVDAYTQQVRGATRYADYLIERARTQFGTRNAEAKQKALNFLLPHIRRIPSAIARAEFAENAAQKLGIESNLVRQELKNAAQHRLESVRAAEPRAVTEVERILLNALVLPEADSARALAAERLGAFPEWYSDLVSAPLLEVLANAPAPENPLEAAPDQASRALLASALLHQSQHADAELSASEVERALDSLRDDHISRRQREIRVLTEEARRRGDEAELQRLAEETMRLMQMKRLR